MPKLWIINQFANSPDTEGHTRQFEIANYLVRNGWDVSVFASDFNINKRKYTKLKFPRLIRKDNINGISWYWLWVFPYKKNNLSRYLNIVSFCIHLFFKLSSAAIKKYFQRNMPDIIFASSPQLPATFISLLISKVFSIPFVLEIRDLWPQVLIEEGGFKENNLIIKVLRKMEVLLYEGSNQIIVLSKGVKKHLEDKGFVNTVWLPNGPDLTNFVQKPLRNEPIKFTFENPFKIIYAGAHGQSNALDSVLQAAYFLQNEPIKFIFIGDGPKKQELIKKSTKMDNVEFRNSVPKKNIPIIFDEADAILVSLKDNPLFKYGVSPNKLYDAYAIGRPVIVSIGGIVNKEINDYNIGFSCAPEKPDLLAKIIKKLSICSKTERQNMGNRARKLAESTYSRQRINPIIKNLLINLLNN